MQMQLPISALLVVEATKSTLSLGSPSNELARAMANGDDDANQPGKMVLKLKQDH